MARGPYRHGQLEGSKLEPDPEARRKVRLAGLTTVALGGGIAASAIMLGPLGAAFGGAVALLGLALYREAPASPLKASCPSCRREITGVSPTTDVVECVSCGEHACLTGDVLVPVRHDFVARAPTFEIPLARAYAGLPPICAECGARAHRTGVPLAVSDYEGAVDDEPRIIVVPHCEKHGDGAARGFGVILVKSRALWIEAMSTWNPTPR